MGALRVVWSFMTGVGTRLFLMAVSIRVSLSGM